jgi:hypothetical protein
MYVWILSSLAAYGIAIANVIILIFSPVNDNFDILWNYYYYYYMNCLILYFLYKFLVSFIHAYFVLVIGSWVVELAHRYKNLIELLLRHK